MRRSAAMPLLAAFVLLVHLGLGEQLATEARHLADGAAGDALRRMRAEFVVELRPSTPPKRAPVETRAGRPPRLAAAPPPATAASAPDAPERPAVAPIETETAPGSVASWPDVAFVDPPPETADTEAAIPDAQSTVDPTAAGSAVASATDAVLSPAEPVPMEPVPAADPAASGPAFEWPRSTQLTYRLSGYYRGPVDGTARVEWLYDGAHYQVHVEVSIGPSFAPLVARRMSSEGEVGAAGLVPRRYEEETRVILRDPRRVTVTMDDSTVRLANGQTFPRPPGIQDTASQFVHLTWLFTTQPQRLVAGESVGLMLALPRRVGPWTYDVQEAETLYTDAGAIEAVPVRPRRADRSRGELSAELWVAPSLQYLPVRFVIRQDEENHVDLLLDRLPQQAVAKPR